MGARTVQEPEDVEALEMRDFLRMERDGTRIEGSRLIRTFWNEQGRRFELDARGHCWREVPRIGPRPGPPRAGTPLRCSADGPCNKVAARARGTRPDIPR